MKTAPIQPGDVFTRWTVVKRMPSLRQKCGSSTPMWLCKCECGASKEVRAVHLRSGRSKSCGCLQREIAAAVSFKHGGRDSPLYEVWTQMIQRCENPRNKSFKNYGGRGIKVCQEWHDYTVFLRDMGSTYQPGLTIDRKENDGHYEPGNCRWVTNKVNCRNQRRSIRVQWDGKSVALNDLAELCGVKALTAYSRFIIKGWTLRQSIGLDAPPKKNRRPISEQTRQRMAEARRQWWARKELA